LGRMWLPLVRHEHRPGREKDAEPQREPLPGNKLPRRASTMTLGFLWGASRASPPSF